MLHDLGIELLPRTEADRIIVDEQVTGVGLIDGGSIDAELCLVATGIVPNSELAEAAGLDVAVGVTVDDGMLTSDPHIFAVGDVVDHGGRRYGLWPASVEQAQVAATKMVGGEATFGVAAQPARLKVPGIDLLSVGVVDARARTSRISALVTSSTARGPSTIRSSERCSLVPWRTSPATPGSPNTPPRGKGRTASFRM
jgi:NAD(P)H-nitrite reductase large subunit